MHRYLNNRLEQDHRGIKGRCHSMRGFGSFPSAARFCAAHDEVCDSSLHCASNPQPSLVSNQRTGCSWRVLPSPFGPWLTVYGR